MKRVRGTSLAITRLSLPHQHFSFKIRSRPNTKNRNLALRILQLVASPIQRRRIVLKIPAAKIVMYQMMTGFKMMSNRMNIIPLANSTMITNSRGL